MTDQFNTVESSSQDRCIWMTAGVVSYKLCPYHYDCEHCDFDRAMQLQFKGRELPVKKISAANQYRDKVTPKDSDSLFTFSVGSLPEDYYFHMAHVWVHARNSHEWVIGIDRLLSYILPPSIGFEIYGKKNGLETNEVFCKIVTTAGTLFLTTPLSGTLLQPNPNLAFRPELLQEDPLGEGWLARIRWSQNRSELKAFYSGSEAEKFLSEEACHLRHVLKYQGVEVGRVGRTLTDGGNNIQYLHQILPAKSCLKLSRVLTAFGKVNW